MNIMQRGVRKGQVVLQRTLEYSFFSVAATTLVLFVSLAMVYQAFQSSNGSMDSQPIEITSTGPIIVAAEPGQSGDGNVLGVSDTPQTSASAAAPRALANNVQPPADQPAQAQSQPATGSSTMSPGSTGGKPAPPPAVPGTKPDCNSGGVLDHLVDQVGGVVHALLLPVQLTTPSCPT